MITAVKLDDGTWREWRPIPTQAEQQRHIDIANVRRRHLMEARDISADRQHGHQ